MILKGLSQSSPRTVLAGVFILSALPFLMVQLFPSRLYHVMDIASYLVFHDIAEFFSIMVSFSIFGVGWYTYEQSEDRHALYLSFAFLGIGLMDFMHTLSYAGMPDFITPNSANKSTQFWIAVRLFAASVFLISAYIYPDRPLRWLSKQNLTAAALVVSGLVFAGIVFYPSQMPATFIEGIGLTPFKKLSEYLIICLLFLASVAYWRRLSKTGDRLLLYYIAAFIICIFSELVFAVYKSVFDTFNVLGHIYKVVAFALIYKGIFTASVKSPYLKLVDTSEKLRTDIIERKKAEEELRNALKRVEYEKGRSEAIIAAIGDGITIQDKDFKILYQNQVQINFTGNHVGEYCYTAYRGIEHTCEECPVAMSFKDGKIHTVERSVLTDKGMKYFENTAAVLKDSEGKIIAGIEVVRDITERKRMEESLQESEDKFRDLAEKSVVGIYLIQDGIFKYVNPMLAEIFGYTVGEIIDKKGPEDLVLSQDWPIVRENLRRRISGEIESTHYGFKGIKKTKEIIHVEVYGSKTVYKTRPAVIGTLLDITERKRAEEDLRQKFDELERFMRETVKREFRIVELKEKVAKLEEELKKKA